MRITRIVSPNLSLPNLPPPHRTPPHPSAPHPSVFLESHASESLDCYDVLTRGAGPGCLLLVALSRAVRSEPSAAVIPAAATALAALLAEPVFTAHVMASLASPTGASAAAAAAALAPSAGALFSRGRRDTAAATAATAAAVDAASSLVSRARWLAGSAQLALWAACMVSLWRLGLRASRASRGSSPTLGSYLLALRALAAGKRRSGVWRGEGVPCEGGWATGGEGPSEKPGGPTRRSNGFVGSLCERLSRPGALDAGRRAHGVAGCAPVGGGEQCE